MGSKGRWVDFKWHAGLGPTSSCLPLGVTDRASWEEVQGGSGTSRKQEN